MRAFSRSTGLFAAFVACVLGTTALISAQDGSPLQEQTKITQDKTVRDGPVIVLDQTEPRDETGQSAQASAIEEVSDPRIKWEYKIIRHNGHAEATNAQPLNELGGDGWELCESHVMPDTAPRSRLLLIFKRHASQGLEPGPAQTDSKTNPDREEPTSPLDESNN